MTQRIILENVWGPEWVEDAQTLRVHVSNLRKKIEPQPGGPRYIITEPGVGFRFASADSEPATPDAEPSPPPAPHVDAFANSLVIAV